MADGDDPHAPLLHGGNLAAAAMLFPAAPRPFVDLSTGINPFAYPLPPLAPEVFSRLPERDACARLEAAASALYGAPGPAHVVAAPGMQSLLAPVAALVAPGRAAILGPTYAEHARAAAAAGHRVEEVTDLAALAGAEIAVLVNPNNPDGRLLSTDVLAELAEAALARRGVLVVDEAFMDALDEPPTLAPAAVHPGLVVLRSFGKFFGLAGLRVSFAIAAPAVARRLRAALGPWAVSGPAIAVGTRALADRAWAEATRARLGEAAARLDALLGEARLPVTGGTPLFRLVRAARAEQVFYRLGAAGILVRHFPERPGLLRFGLPGPDKEWERLRAALFRMR